MADGILNPIEQLEADFDFEVYTKQEVDALLDEKADKSDTYTKTETDALLDEKADADAVYTKTETDTLLSAKADKSTTLAGYGITDAYTKTQTDNLLNGKADADDVYTKTEIDTKIPNSVGSATKPVYVNGGVVSACTYELNKTVPANAVFTDTTYTAGNGLNLSSSTFSAKAGTNVTVDASGINVNGNGAVASANTGLINGGTAYTELRPTLDGTWVKNAQTTATNLQKLEGGIEYLYGLLSHQYDQLKKYINGNYYDYDTDTDSKYTKTVPNGAMPYASLDSIGGKTVVWNQLNDNSASTATNSGVTLTNNQDGSWTANNTATGGFSKALGQINLVNEHKYYIGGCPSGGSDSTFFLTLQSFGKDYGDGTILSWTNTTQSRWLQLSYSTGVTFNNVTFYPIVRDLTLMFGSGNEPSTVAEYNAMFPNDTNVTYNAGTLLSAGVTEVKSVGKNIFDKNAQMEVISAYRYYPVPIGATQTLHMTFADKDTSVSLSGINIGFVKGNSGVATDYRWIIQNGVVQQVNTNIINYKLLDYVFIYPNTQEAFDKLTSRYDICVSLENSYSPYMSATYPIPAEIQALDGYGWSAGSVFNYIDYERKVFVQRVASVDLGTLTWAYSYNRFSADVPNMNTSTTTRLDGLTCIYPIDTNSYIDENMSDKTCKRYAGKVLIKDSAYTTTSAFTSAMSGVYLYYELATPVEVDISAYITDDNLIEVEAGGTLAFPNSNGTDYQIPVPSSETYMVDLQSAI